MKTTTIKEWKNLVGRKATLIYQPIKKLPTYDEHKKFLKNQGRIYEDLTETEIKKKFDSYIDHLEKFNSLCKTGESVEIIDTDRKDVIILSKNWKGKLTLYSDIEVWLWSELKIPSFKKTFKSEMYSFGQIVVPAGDPIAHFEGAGTSLVSNSKGEYEVIFDNYFNPKRIEFRLIDGLGASEGAIFELK